MSTLESARIWWRSKWPSANRPIIRLPSCNPNTSSVNLISGPRVNAPFQCCQLGFWGFYHISKVSGWFILKFIRQIACKYHYWICEFQDDSFTTSWDINQKPQWKKYPPARAESIEHYVRHAPSRPLDPTGPEAIPKPHLKLGDYYYVSRLVWVDSIYILRISC